MNKKKSTQAEIKVRLARYGLFKRLSIKFPQTESEELLWKSVIDRALTDVIEPTDIAAFSEAYEWFDIENTDFLQVCSNAFLDPAWVLEIFNLLLNLRDEEL